MRISLFLLLASLLSPGSARAETLVYVSESKDKKIAVFSLNESTGELTRSSELELDGAPGCLALSHDGKRLHASVRSASQFATLAIEEKTGKLSVLSTAPSAGSAAYIYADKTGKWLLGAYYGEGVVSVSRLEDGKVSGEPIQVVETGKKAHCIQLDPSNRFAFTPHPMDLNKVQQHVFDAETGELTMNDPPQLDGAEGAGPRHMQFHPKGKWVYLVNEQGKSVTHCLFDAEKGTLSKKKTLSTHPADWDPKQGSCADIEISADGKFLYASNRGHDSIAVFRIDAESGELTSLGQTPTEKTPRSFNLIPGDNERFLVAAGQGSDTLIVYQRDADTGALKPLKTYECGGSPAWVLGVVILD